MENATDFNRFVLVAHPRSGTNFLREILTQHPRILMAGEIFHTDPSVLRFIREKTNPFQEPGDRAGDIFPMASWDDGPMALGDLDAFNARCREVTGRETIGFSLFAQAMGHALSDAEVEDLVLQPGVRPILLFRENLLKAFVSAKRAFDTGAWHMDERGSFIQYPFAASPPGAMMHLIDAIDLHEAQAWMEINRRFLERVESALEKAGKPFLKVSYEALCMRGPERTRAEVDRATAFLGLEPHFSFEARTSQTASGEFYDSIPNRQELVDATGYDLNPPPTSPHGWVARIALRTGEWKAQGRTIAIAPAGRFARGLLALADLRETRLVGFFDRDPGGSGAAFEGLPIHGYGDLGRIRPDHVLVASPLYEDEIVAELRNQGYPEEGILRLSRMPTV